MNNDEIILAKAREIRNKYQRDYNRKNKEKRKKSNNDYWIRKAIQKLKEEGAIDE